MLSQPAEFVLLPVLCVLIDEPDPLICEARHRSRRRAWLVLACSLWLPVWGRTARGQGGAPGGRTTLTPGRPDPTMARRGNGRRSVSGHLRILRPGWDAAG